MLQAALGTPPVQASLAMSPGASSPPYESDPVRYTGEYARSSAPARRPRRFRRLDFRVGEDPRGARLLGHEARRAAASGREVGAASLLARMRYPHRRVAGDG